MKHKHRSQWNLLFLVVVLILYCSTNTTSAKTTLSDEEIREKALEATVYLEMKNINGDTLGIGSGFFVKSNIIATNSHVIEGAAKGTAKLVGKYTTYKIEGITAIDRINDLVLLKVTSFGIKPLSLGNSDNVRINEKITVYGVDSFLSDNLDNENVNKIDNKFVGGHWDFITMKQYINKSERFIINASCMPVASGGPVLNNVGEVIGMSYYVHEYKDKALSIHNLGDILYENGRGLVIPSKFLKNLLTKSSLVTPLEIGKDYISVKSYFKWGLAKHLQGDYKGALNDYTQAIRLKHDFTDACINRGALNLIIGQYNAAIMDYNTIIRTNPGYILAYQKRAEANSKLGQYNSAIRDLDTIIHLDPNFSSAYFSRGSAKVSIGQFASAITDFNSAIGLNPEAAFSYMGRGDAKLSLGQYFAAISDYDTFIRLIPDNAYGYTRRGKSKALLEQYFAAIVDYDTAIRLKPDYAEAYYLRGLSKVLLNRALEAKQDLRTALRLAIKAGNASVKTEVEDALRILKE